MQFRDLQRQYNALKDDIDQALCQTAASGRYIMGNAVAELERQLAEYVGVEHCMTCGNGTDALTLALKALGIGKGDAVFVPDFTFFATAEVVALEGATPVFVDVCEDTFNISSSSLEEAIYAVQCEGRLTPRAVIAVDLFGQPFLGVIQFLTGFADPLADGRVIRFRYRQLCLFVYHRVPPA